MSAKQRLLHDDEVAFSAEAELILELARSYLELNALSAVSTYSSRCAGGPGDGQASAEFLQYR